MVAPAGMWTLLASAMRLPISSGGRPPKCEAAIAARTSSSVMASTTGYKPCPDDNAQPIQVHTRKLLQPRMPGKVTKRGPLRAGLRPTPPSAASQARLGCHPRWYQRPTGRSSGRRGLGQDLQAQVPALVADPGQLTEFARRHRQAAGDQMPHRPGLQAAEAALGLR